MLVGAIRDEFIDRAWDAPGHHWPGDRSHLIGGRDRTAGGTWLAVAPTRPAMAALLNGFRRPPLDAGTRPSRGELALRILTVGDLPAELSAFDRFHLLAAAAERVELWTWDGDELHHHLLEPGTHIVVNGGLDAEADPLVPHFAPLLANLPPAGPNLADAQRSWRELLGGDGLDPADERALLVRREIDGRTYGSTSASFVALSADAVRYEFNPEPARMSAWVALPTS